MFENSGRSWKNRFKKFFDEEDPVIVTPTQLETVRNQQIQVKTWLDENKKNVSEINGGVLLPSLDNMFMVECEYFILNTDHDNDSKIVVGLMVRKFMKNIAKQFKATLI